MNLERLTPIVEQVFKQVLSQNRYPFGVKGGTGNKVASGRLRVFGHKTQLMQEERKD